MSIDRYFDGKPSTDPPQVREWKKKGLTPQNCNLERKHNGIGFQSAMLLVFLQTESGERTSKCMLWDFDVNDWLVRQSCRAQTVEEEHARFGFMLHESMRPVMNRYGDGFFNSILIQELRSHNEISSHPIFAEDFPSYTSSSRPAIDCKEMIEHALSKCGSELLRDLKYSHQEARSILIEAIFYFLDERFNIKRPMV